MIPTRRLGAVLLVLLLLAGGALAYTSVFTAGAGTTYETPSGLVVSTNTAHGLNDANPFTGTDTVYVDGVTFSASGTGAVTVDQFRGTRTKLSGIDATSNTITVNPDDKSAVDISGSVTALDWEDAALDGTAQLTYSASGSGTIVIDGLPGSTDYAAATTGGTVLSTGTTTAGGEATISVSSGSNVDVVLLTPIPATTSSASPTGGTTFHDDDVGASIDVSDADFGTDSGDSVTLDFYVDGSQVDSATIGSNQTVSTTFSGLSDGSHTWHVETTDSYGETSSSSTFNFDVSHRDPSVDAASASPTGDLSARPSQLSINVSDADFATDGDEQLTVTFSEEGSTVGTDTLTSNGTASVAISDHSGGTHNWSVTVDDNFGRSVSSQTFQYRTPSSLTIRNESAPSKLVDNVTAEVRFYFDGNVSPGLIVKRNASNGTLNMTGLPTDQPFIVTVDTPGYRSRRIFVESLYEQQSIYLLPTSEPFDEQLYDLEDYTGKYPDDVTVLKVQRALTRDFDGDGTVETRWETVLGDYFGATGTFSARVRDGVRHRMVLYNTQTGATRPLGSYTPIASTTVGIVVRPDTTVVEQSQPPTALVRPQLRQLPALGGSTLTVTLDNRTETVDSWQITATLNNSTVWNQTVSSAGEYSHAVDLSGHAGQPLTVTVTYSDANGTYLIGQATYRVVPTPSNGVTLLDSLSGLTELAAPGTENEFTSFVAMLLTILVMGGISSQFRVGGEGVGLVGVLVLTGFSVIGWVSYDLVFVAGVGVISMAALRRGL